MGKGSRTRPVSKDYGKNYKPFREFKLNIMSDENRKISKMSKKERDFKKLLSQFDNEALSFFYINNYWGEKITLEEGLDGTKIKLLEENSPNKGIESEKKYKQWLEEIKNKRGK